MNEISKLTGVAKSTIYYHYRRIRGRTLIPVTVSQQDPELTGEFLGLFAGDGSFHLSKKYHYRVSLFFNVNESNYVDNLIKFVLLKLFNKAPMVCRQRNVLAVMYNSKSIYGLIKSYLRWSGEKTYSIRLRKRPHSRAFMIGFLRGSMDRDGYFDEHKLQFSSVSRNLIEDISYFLHELGIGYAVYRYHEKRPNRKDIYHVNVAKKDQEFFHMLIAPRNKRK